MNNIGIGILIILSWIWIQVAISSTHNCSTFNSHPELCNSDNYKK